MNKTGKKNKSPAIFFVVVFVIIIVITFVANRRSSIVNEIRLPMNEGVTGLSTFNNFLSAVSNDKRLYVWDWADMSKKPNITAVESIQAAMIASDKIVSLRQTNPPGIFVSGLSESEIKKEIIVPAGSEGKYLAINRNGSRIFILTRLGSVIDEMRYELFEVLIDSGQALPIVAIKSKRGEVGHISVSDSGRFIVADGEKNGQGWMFVVDVNEKQLKWQKEFPDMKIIYKAIFSTDREIIYARGTDSTLLVIDVNSGEIINRLLPTDENKSTYRTQQTQTVAVSPDGSLVAATVFSSVYVWDTKTLKKFYIGESGHKVISSIVFSPDSRLLATSDMRQGGKIQILRMPRN